MRRIPGEIIPSNNFIHPFTAIISGSSGVGKTSFVTELIRSNRVSNIKQFSAVYYYYPSELDYAPVDWADEFETLEVCYHNDEPNAAFFANVKKDSLLVYDDDYYNLSSYSSFANAFRVFARKYQFSIIAINQTYFEGQRHARSIRNNCDVHVLFNNYGDASINLRVARSLGYTKRFKEAQKEAYDQNHGHVLLFTGPKVSNNKLRVQINFFDERKNYCFY